MNSFIKQLFLTTDEVDTLQVDVSVELKEFNKLLFLPIPKGHLLAVGCGAGLVFFLSLTLQL